MDDANIKVIKSVLKSKGIKDFKKKPNHTVVIGLIDNLSVAQRSKMLEVIVADLKKTDEFKKSTVEIQTSVSINRKTYKSDAKTIRIDVAGKDLPYVVMLKPKTISQFSLTPKSFGISGNFSASQYEDVLYSHIMENSNVSRYGFDTAYFLIGLVEAVFDKNKTVKKKYAALFDDSSVFLEKIVNSQFSELLAPVVAIHKQYPNTIPGDLTINFPPSQIARGYDFSLMTRGVEMKYSVKSMATKLVNTIKPDSLIDLIEKTPTVKQKKKYADEIELLTILKKESAIEGAKKVYKKLNIDPNEKDKNKKLEDVTKKMDFTELLAELVRGELSFVTFKYDPRTHQWASNIKTDASIAKIKQSNKRLYLRSKMSGTKTEKIGLTPPT